jgi:heme-degrading monooxygenase HmoA
MEAVAQFYSECALPQLDTQPGFETLWLLVDRENDRLISIAHWDSLEAMNAFDVTCIEEVEALTALLVSPPTVDIYEMALKAQAKFDPQTLRFSSADFGLRTTEG